jgi:hypothetical protein
MSLRPSVDNDASPYFSCTNMSERLVAGEVNFRLNVHVKHVMSVLTVPHKKSY